jgi:ubiquinone/menaquinone biosynthesis C-methylase UbiE
MTERDWYLDELIHAGPEHLDADYVAAYDEKAQTDWDAEVATLRDLGLGPESTLVDLGTGTGGLALAAAAVCKRVIAVDISPAMVAIVRQRAEAAGLRNVEPVQAGLVSYQHQGEPVDFVYSRHALHHLPDFWKAVAFQRIATMLRPGGVFRLRDLLFSCALSEINAVVDGWLGRASTTPGVGWQRSELAIHMRDEYSTFTWLIEPMLIQAGFTIDSAEYDGSHIYTAYTCRKTV